MTFNAASGASTGRFQTLQDGKRPALAIATTQGPGKANVPQPGISYLGLPSKSLMPQPTRNYRLTIDSFSSNPVTDPSHLELSSPRRHPGAGF